jgi:putative SOS response-associated peptidase YedK
MCYSSLAEKDFKKLNHEMGASPWPDAFDQLEAAQSFESAVGPDTIKSLLGLSRKPQSTKFRYCDNDGRFYPNWFAPVIIQQDSKKRIVPMRYRIRPNRSDKEVPTKYNMFNAKVESLGSRQSWRHLVGRNHAVIAVKQFYEFVNKCEIGIEPADSKLLKFAAIYDTWSSPENEISFCSFAIITGPPPKSVLELGHHRCPITLSDNEVDQWLSSNNSNEAIGLLKSAAQFEYKQAV